MENIILEVNEENLHYDVEVRTDIGGRDEQQDYAYVNIGKQVFAVLCDGMGGMSDGKAASYLTVNIMHSMYSEYLKNNSREAVTIFMHDAMVSADEKLARVLGGRAGTTIVAVYLSKNDLFWLSAGDSRLYIFRNNEMIQATRDHNYFLKLNEMLESNVISTEIYQHSAQRGKALISYIGMGGIKLFDLTETALTVFPGDIILLATDGLFRTIAPEVIKAVLSTDRGLNAKADELMTFVRTYVKKDVRDNTTFILIQIL